MIVQIGIDSNCRFSTKKEDQEYLKLPHNNNGFIHCVGEIIDDDLYYKGKKVLSMSELKVYSPGKLCVPEKEEHEEQNNEDNNSSEIDSDSSNDDSIESNNDEIISRAIGGTISVTLKNGKTTMKSKNKCRHNDDNSEFCEQHKNHNSYMYYNVFITDDISDNDDADALWLNTIYLNGIKITNAWLMIAVFDN